MKTQLMVTGTQEELEAIHDGIKVEIVKDCNFCLKPFNIKEFVRKSSSLGVFYVAGLCKDCITFRFQNREALSELFGSITGRALVEVLREEQPLLSTKEILKAYLEQLQDEREKKS